MMTDRSAQAPATQVSQKQQQEPAMIQARKISKVYKVGKTAQVAAVREASLDVKPGEFIVITGRSGSGKTTLLHLIAGLTRPTTGSVLIDGRDTWALPDEEQSRFRSQNLGFIFQFPSLLPALTVFENVHLPAGFTGRSQGDAGKRRAVELLDLVGLSDKANAYPRHLSAGQQQRVVIARSLINQPKLLLADEPTSNLDDQTEKEIMSLLEDVRSATGVTVLLVVACGGNGQVRHALDLPDSRGDQQRFGRGAAGPCARDHPAQLEGLLIQAPAARFARGP